MYLGIEVSMEKQKLIFVESFPDKQDFTAVWFTNFMGKPTMFSATLYYNEKEDQYYTYDPEEDIFWPECDHGYDKQFFNKVNASFLIEDKT